MKPSGSFFESSSDVVYVLEYDVKSSPDGHVEHHFDVFRTMADASDFQRTILGNRLVYASCTSRHILDCKPLSK